MFFLLVFFLIGPFFQQLEKFTDCDGLVLVLVFNQICGVAPSCPLWSSVHTSNNYDVQPAPHQIRGVQECMSCCHRTPLVWSCTSWSRMALHMLTQSKLGIQTGKELHSHLNFLPVRNLILKAENFRRTQNTQKLKHKTTNKEEIALQPVWRKGSELYL